MVKDSGPETPTWTGSLVRRLMFQHANLKHGKAMTFNVSAWKVQQAYSGFWARLRTARIWKWLAMPTTTILIISVVMIISLPS